MTQPVLEYASPLAPSRRASVLGIVSPFLPLAALVSPLQVGARISAQLVVLLTIGFPLAAIIEAAMCKRRLALPLLALLLGVLVFAWKVAWQILHDVLSPSPVVTMVAVQPATAWSVIALVLLLLAAFVLIGDRIAKTKRPWIPVLALVLGMPLGLWIDLTARSAGLASCGLIGVPVLLIAVGYLGTFIRRAFDALRRRR